MKLLKLLTILSITQFSVFNISWAKSISDTDIRNSVLKNYPLILAGYDKVDAAKGNYRAAKGVFDIRLKQELLDYSRGFYDGKYNKTSIERQNRFLGSSIYGGYRRSYREFEDYEGQRDTTRNGEFFAGINIPLLQGRAIDENRLGEMLAEYDFDESKVNLENIKIKIQKDALKAYWNWVASAKIYKIIDDLYKLSLNRDKQLRKRLKKGDVAEIIVVENKQNLLKRKNEMIFARANFKNSAIFLSLFYRDKDGQPFILGEQDLPKINFSTNVEKFNSINLNDDINSAINDRAEIRILRLNRLKENANLKYAKNLFQPRLDLNLEASKDVGGGDQSLSQSRNKVGLQLALPLQFSNARGKKSAAISKLSAIEYEEKIRQEQIKTELKQININITNSAEMLGNLKQEVKLARRLEKAERKRFRYGASNFFVVNLREQISANSRVKQIEAWQKLQNFKADYMAARFRFD